MSDLTDELATFERNAPSHLADDSIWRLPAYRIGAFMADVAEADCVRLRRHPQCLERAAQLQQAIDAIPANISEGYGRISGKERARFYEIAMASAREARDWYHRVRHVLGTPATQERTLLLTRVIRILTKAIPEERAGASEERIRRAADRNRRRQDHNHRAPRSAIDPASDGNSEDAR